MEPEQERLSKLYSGSGIQLLPELNPNRKQKYKCISRKQKQEKTSRNNQCFDMIYAFTNK